MKIFGHAAEFGSARVHRLALSVWWTLDATYLRAAEAQHAMAVLA